MERTRILRAVVLGAAALMILSGCGGDDGSPAGPGIPPGQEIFISDPAPEDIMSVTFTYEDDTVHTRDVPVNQMLLMFDPDVTAAQAASTLETMVADLTAYSLALVGQMPRVGIYQLEIINDAADPADAIDVLDTVIDLLLAYPRVADISYNELLEEHFAENDDDNTEMIGLDRAAYGMIDYFQAIPAFDAVLGAAALSPIKVAVIDTGIDLDTDQFDDIQGHEGGFEYLDVGFPDNDPADWHLRKHGTAVASIIAADNGDGVANGIALRVLGDKLSLFVANIHTAGDVIHLARTIAAVEIAVQRGARIVNLSLGSNDDGRTPRWLTRLQDQYMRIFTAPGAEDVLFVCAASNDRLNLDGNGAPDGLPAPNCLTVGGLNSSLWEVIYTDSARGPGIDIAAPATQVGVCCFGYDEFFWRRHYMDGNSFAAPIVSSIAAIVLSIEPTLSGSDLKDFMTDPNNTYPAPEDVGGVRPALLKTAGTALLEMGSPANDANSLLDAFFGMDDNVCDPPGHVVNRMVGEVAFEVAGPGYAQSHSLGADDLVYDALGQNFGLIQPGSFVVNFARGSEIVNIGIDREFELGRTYTIPADGGFLMTAGNPDGNYLGFGEGGTLTFSACEIATRAVPLDYFDDGFGIDRYVFIEIQGTLTGGVAVGIINSDPPQEDVTYTTSGSFTTGFIMLAPNTATIDHLEEVCLGGYRYTGGE
jgi:subtilisin family serine protease